VRAAEWIGGNGLPEAQHVYLETAASKTPGRMIGVAEAYDAPRGIISRRPNKSRRHHRSHSLQPGLRERLEVGRGCPGSSSATPILECARGRQMAGILSKCRSEMSESHLLLEVHLGRMEDGEVLNALLLESTRPVSLTIHLPNKAVGERIQVVLVYTVHTEDEIDPGNRESGEGARRGAPK